MPENFNEDNDVLTLISEADDQELSKEELRGLIKRVVNAQILRSFGGEDEFAEYLKKEKQSNLIKTSNNEDSLKNQQKELNQLEPKTRTQGQEVESDQEDQGGVRENKLKSAYASEEGGAEQEHDAQASEASESEEGEEGVEQGGSAQASEAGEGEGEGGEGGASVVQKQKLNQEQENPVAASLKSQQQGDAKIENKKEKEEGSGKIKKRIKVTDKLLTKAWMYSLPSFSFSVIYVYIHVLIRNTPFKENFSPLGHEWIPFEQKRTNPKISKKIGDAVGLIEKPVTAGCCLLHLFLLLLIITVIYIVIFPKKFLCEVFFPKSILCNLFK